VRLRNPLTACTDFSYIAGSYLALSDFKRMSIIRAERFTNWNE